MITDAMGVTIDRVTYERQVEVAPQEITVPSGVFPAGSVVGIRFKFVGWVDGEAFVTLDFVWRAADGVAPEWPAGHFAWQIEIDGDPTIRTAVELATETDSKRPTSLTVAMSCVNALPVVVSAAPGILNPLALPPVAGRGARSLRS